MGQVLHRSATTTEAIRRAIEHSQESLRALARRHGINPKTVAKWKKRESTVELFGNFHICGTGISFLPASIFLSRFNMRQSRRGHAPLLNQLLSMFAVLARPVRSGLAWRYLSRVFRGKFIAGLKQLLFQDKLQFHGSLHELHDPERFRRFLRQLYTDQWVVYAKPPFGGAEHVLHYLVRYTSRVAISNHWLVAFNDGRVSFRWKDYAHGSKQKVMTVSSNEFLRRFLLHVLPRGLVRIRHFGLFANRRRAASLTRCRALLDALPPPKQLPESSQLRCPLCSGPMLVTERMTGSQLLPRNCIEPAIKTGHIESS